MKGEEMGAKSHTKGPWLAAASPTSIVGWPVVAPANGRHICDVSFMARCPGDDELWLDRQVNRESEANARLIAAAPDGLAVARAFVAHYPVGVNPMLDQAYRDARAFIAKATEPPR